MTTTAVTSRSHAATEADSMVAEHHTLRNDLAALHTKLSHATEEEKEAVQSRIAATRAKMHEASERARTQEARLKQEVDTKIKELEAQRASANAETKAKIDARLTELRTAYHQRAAKLTQARALTDEALAR